MASRAERAVRLGLAARARAGRDSARSALLDHSAAWGRFITFNPTGQKPQGSGKGPLGGVLCSHPNAEGAFTLWPSLRRG